MDQGHHRGALSIIQMPNTVTRSVAERAHFPDFCLCREFVMWWQFWQVSERFPDNREEYSDMIMIICIHARDGVARNSE